MKKKKNQKRYKKWRSLILLLFLTIIMFGTSTYAWFTANRVVTINAINVNVQASNGIQISTNAVDWKSVLTNMDITNNAYSGNNNQLPGVVTAVSTAGTVDTTTGLLDMFIADIDNDASTGSYVLTAEADTEPGGSSGHFVAFDVFLRVDQRSTISLTSDSDVLSIGTDKGLKNASRVGFVYLGHGDSDDDPADLIALNSPASKAIIWEPNADAHSTVVQTSVAPEYSVTLSASSNTTYYGLKAEVPDPVDLKTIVASGMAAYTSQVTPDVVTLEENSVYSQIFILETGVTKYRVYMWIEGQDIDCENNATGSNISFNVQLSTEASASGTPSSSNGG